jgi:hypothetical protein
MKKPKSSSSSLKDIGKKPRVMSPEFMRNIERVKAGEIKGGRPKGSRSVFAETFLKDFLADWREHGTTAIAQCRKEDPTSYIKVAASLLPKDFNLNLTNEAEIGKLLDKFNIDELRNLAAGLAAVGAASLQGDTKKDVGDEPDSIH